MSKASSSGFARNISLITRGSSSTGVGLEAIDTPAEDGTLMLLKSKFTEFGGIARRFNFNYEKL